MGPAAGCESTPSAKLRRRNGESKEADDSKTSAGEVFDTCEGQYEAE
jgi:hypothetical protein